MCPCLWESLSATQPPTSLFEGFNYTKTSRTQGQPEEALTSLLLDASPQPGGRGAQLPACLGSNRLEGIFQGPKKPPTRDSAPPPSTPSQGWRGVPICQVAVFMLGSFPLSWGEIWEEGGAACLSTDSDSGGVAKAPHRPHTPSPCLS